MGAPMQTPRIEGWHTEAEEAAMLAYLDVEPPSGVQFIGCKLMVGARGAGWLAMPGAMRRDSDGNPVLGPNGKPIWDQAVAFRDKATREKFQDQVLAVLCRSNPELFVREPDQ